MAKVGVSVRIEKSLLDDLDARAAAMQASRSATLELILKKFFDENAAAQNRMLRPNQGAIS